MSCTVFEITRSNSDGEGHSSTFEHW